MYYRKLTANCILKGIVSIALFAIPTLRSTAQDVQLPVSGVTATANDGNVPANTLDGSLSTRWSAYGDGQTITYDLGATPTVSSVQLAWYKGNQRVATFDIRTSSDGAAWTTVFSGKSSGKTLNFETYNVTDTKARYVAIVCHGNNKDLWNSITETRIIGSTPVAPPPTTETHLPVVSVTASANDGNVPANTLDGNLGTRWSANGDGQWIRFDLGSNQAVTSVDVAWYKGNTRAAKFDILTSVDDSTWTTVYSGMSSGTNLNFETYPFASSTARYVSIVGHGNTVDTWNSITEVAVYGNSTTNTSTGSTPPPPPPPAVGAVPASILNLTNWKLTLPIDTAHAGSPDEIVQPELSTFQDEYFHTNATGNGVVFAAPCGGATTSGSGYPRSELREMTNNGSTAASWSTTSGTHTMTITQAVTHLPVVKPQIVAGQIHGPSDDVIVFRLEGQKLFIDLNGTQGPVLNNQYNLGDIFTVKFVAHNGGVDCYYNGNYIYTYPVSQSGCYFKAGAYTQSNTSKGDAATAYGEVVIYGLSVVHQ
jgi:hypothetical protein